MSAIDDYIADFPPEVQTRMRAIRKTILKAAPDAAESITYRIPTFKVNGKAVAFFAGFGNHISVYPAPIGNPAFATDLASYASGKGTAKFPHDIAIPFDLITKMVMYRISENRRIAESKASKKKQR